MKIYCHRTAEWTWITKTNDKDPYEFFVNYATAGKYTLSLSGRLQHHCVDRIVLHQSSVTAVEATDLSLPESFPELSEGNKKIKSISFESETLLTN